MGEPTRHVSPPTPLLTIFTHTTRMLVCTCVCISKNQPTSALPISSSQQAKNPLRRHPPHFAPLPPARSTLPRHQVGPRRASSRLSVRACLASVVRCEVFDTNVHYDVVRGGRDQGFAGGIGEGGKREGWVHKGGVDGGGGVEKSNRSAEWRFVLRFVLRQERGRRKERKIYVHIRTV